jgi:tetratricopeptide (TPR) repeat protein
MSERSRRTVIEDRSRPRASQCDAAASGQAPAPSGTLAGMTEGEALAALRGDDPVLAARAEGRLWELWCHAGIPEVDRLLQEGIQAMERRELTAAIDCFTRIIERAPAFAEGWNKRATARYVAEDFAGAVADCEETLARNPHHFGALSGQGLCHMALGQFREAAALFRRALTVHPHLTSAGHNLTAALSEAVKGNGH